MKITTNLSWAKAFLEKNGQEKNIVFEIEKTENNINQLLTQLRQGEVEAIAVELSDAPTELPKDLAITALTKRLDASYTIVLNGGDFQENQLLGLSSDVVFEVEETDYLPFLLKEFSENYTFFTKNEENKSQVSIKSAFLLDENDVKIKKLNPKEFPPLVGKGILALICHREDKTTRRILKNIHHSETAALSNVERSLKKLIAPNPCGVFCEKDKMDNIHLWAAIVKNGEVQRTRISSSTAFGLAESAAKNI